MIDGLVAISDILIDDTVVLHREYLGSSYIPDDCYLRDKVDRDTREWIDDGTRCWEERS